MGVKYPLVVADDQLRERIEAHWDRLFDIEVYPSVEAALEATDCGATYRDNGHDRAVLDCEVTGCPFGCIFTAKWLDLDTFGGIATNRPGCPAVTKETER
ncbi:hypothetical protein GCM10027447_34700 [Glycomyces halotolerans]